MMKQQYIHNILLDDNITNEDGQSISDFEKLVKTLPSVLGHFENIGKVDYSTLSITTNRDGNGFTLLTVIVFVEESETTTNDICGND